MYFWAGRGSLFIADEWAYILNYDGWTPEALLKPAAGHLVGFPMLIYRATIELFGIDSYLPFRVEYLFLRLLTVGIFYLYVRRRIGDWALIPAALLLLLGSAWEVMLSSLFMPHQMALAAGLGALLALDARSRRGDVLTCALLLLAVGSLELGLAFAAGVALEIGLTDGRRAWRRAWIPGIPILLYGAWQVWATKFDDSASITTGGVVSLAHDLRGLNGLDAHGHRGPCPQAG